MKKLLFPAAVLLMLGTLSCKKSNTEDQPQWVDVTVSGRAYEGDTNAPLGGKTVSVNWGPTVFVLPGNPIPDPVPLATTVTNNNGQYTITLRLDARQNEYTHRLNVWMPIDTTTQAAYIGWAYVPRAGYSQSTYASPLVPLQPQYSIDMPLYRRAMLTIRQHPGQTTGWQQFAASFGAHFDVHTHDGHALDVFRIQNNGPTGDSSITVPTLANVYTKVLWSVTGVNGYLGSGVDSIRCTQAGPNEYTINW